VQILASRNIRWCIYSLADIGDCHNRGQIFLLVNHTLSTSFDPRPRLSCLPQVPASEDTHRIHIQVSLDWLIVCLIFCLITMSQCSIHPNACIFTRCSIYPLLSAYRWFISYFSGRLKFVRCGSSLTLTKAVLFSVLFLKVSLGTEPFCTVCSRPARSS